MDQFLPPRLSKELDSRGKPFVEWVTFEDIADKWNHALNSKPKTLDLSKHVPKTTEPTEESVFDLFKSQVNGDLNQSIKDKNSIKWIDNGMGDTIVDTTKSYGVLDRGVQAYHEACMEDSRQDKIVQQDLWELNDMVSQMSGANKLLGW